MVTYAGTWHPGKRRNWIVLLAILALAALLRLYRLEDESLWYDEVVSVQVVDAPSFAEFLDEERKLDPAIVPLYFFLEYHWWHHVWASEYGLRILSVLLGLTTVAGVWWLGGNVYSSRAGAVAAFCTAMAISQVYYAQEIRMYALMIPLAAASVLTLERAVAGTSRYWWLANWIANGLLVWTHILGTLVLFVQGLTLLWIFRRQFRVVSLWTAFQALYLIPLAWWIIGVPDEGVEEHLAWIDQPAGWMILDTFWTVLTGTEFDATGGFFPRNTKSVRSHLLGGLIWCCVAWRVWRSYHNQKGRSGSNGDAPHQAAGTLLLVLWCLVPVLLLVMLSAIVRPCYVERYVIHCGLPIFVLAGGGVDAISSQRMRWALVVLLCAGFFVVTAQLPRPLRPDLKSAHEIIQQRTRGDEMVYLENRFESGLAFAYYAKLDASRIVMGEDSVEQAIARVEAGKPAWLLLVGGGRLARRFADAHLEADMRIVRYRFRGRRPVHLMHAYDAARVPSRTE
ncbi:MAG: glycosyltransferase family 39 protein [Candidatus Hydrogenedentes bacterium]|nr:glycosyltransferase family 39 protein [Candidatus Hydrogenedentota bacterium]